MTAAGSGSDINAAAVAAYRASVQHGKPISERKLAEMFGKTSRRWARSRMTKARQSLAPASRGTRLNREAKNTAGRPAGMLRKSSRQQQVSALAMIGEPDRARVLCQKLLSFAGPLLLYAEEIDTTTGEHLENFRRRSSTWP